MTETIRNGELELTVDAHGAEAVSLMKNGVEYLWTADPVYWNRHAPVLFPFVGQVWDKRYRVDGVEYAMGQHGFARDSAFELAEKTETKLSYVLKSNEETRAKYPFDFAFYVEYELKGSEVEITWRVVNTDSKNLYFSVGGHPGFMCPVNGEGDWADYKILFEKGGQKLDAIKVHKIAEGGCFGEVFEEIPLVDGCVTPSDELFAGDALVLEGMQADKVSLVDPNGKAYIGVSFDAPLVGVWSPVGKHAPFVCIEPWYGRADSVGYEGSLEDRAFGNALAAGETFEVKYTVAVQA